MPDQIVDGRFTIRASGTARTSDAGPVGWGLNGGGRMADSGNAFEVVPETDESGRIASDEQIRTARMPIQTGRMSFAHKFRIVNGTRKIRTVTPWTDSLSSLFRIHRLHRHLTQRRVSQRQRWRWTSAAAAAEKTLSNYGIISFAELDWGPIVVVIAMCERSAASAAFRPSNVPLVDELVSADSNQCELSERMPSERRHWTLVSEPRCNQRVMRR